MKKFSAILLALVLVLAMSATAFAASITINPPTTAGSSTGETYTAYKIFDATINGDNVAYTIAKDSPFYGTIEKSGYFTLTPTVDNANVIVVVKKDSYNDAAAKSLSEELKKVITASTPIAGTSMKQDNGTYKIDNLSTGYYLVTSTVGSALILDTLKDETINSKNTYPELGKTVDKSTANMGDTVTYTITVKIPETAVGEIVVHDKMTGLKYADMTAVDGITAATADLGDSCTVHFTLSADYVAANRGTTVTITYTAIVTANAAKNEAYLVDDNFTSKTDTVETKNYSIPVYKYTKNGEEKTGLAGAGFVLKNAEGKYYKYTAATDTTAAKVEWVEDIKNATEKFTEATSFTVTFEGLANGTYTIIEKTVPAGYNPLTNDPTVTINDADAALTEVENKTGSELPSTGGMGTTIFYVVGGLMMAAAVVILVAKKKVSAEK